MFNFTISETDPTRTGLPAGRSKTMSFMMAVLLVVGAIFSLVASNARADVLFIGGDQSHVLWKADPATLSKAYFGPVLGSYNVPCFSFGVAVDGAGNVYESCSSANNGQVVKLSSTGAVLATNNTSFAGARGMAIHEDGDLLVAEYRTAPGTIKKLRAADLVEQPPFTTDLGLDLGFVVDVAVDSLGNVYVSDRNGAGGGFITKYDPAGVFLEIFADDSRGYPGQMAFASDDTMYVSYTGDSLWKIPQNGVPVQLTATVQNCSGASGLAIDTASTSLYVSCYGFANVHHYDLDGMLLTDGPFSSGAWGGFGLHLIQLAIAPSASADSDNDGVPDGNDLCPGTVSGADVDTNGCSDAQVDADGDGYCDLNAPSSGFSACIGTDNCPMLFNPDQIDVNLDGYGDACVSPNSTIPDNTDIGSNPTIGDSVQLNDSVVIGDDAVLGDNSTVNQNVVVGDSADIGSDVTLSQNIEAGDNLTVGEGSSLNKGSSLGSDVELGTNVTLGKDCMIGSNVQIGDNTLIGQRCVIEDNVVIGANVVIGQGVLVYEGAVISDGTNVPARSEVFPDP